MPEKTPQEILEERIEAAKARRLQTKASEAFARAEQEATDLEAIADLECELGFERVIAIEVGAWRPGMNCPVRVAVRVPLGSEKLCQVFIEKINRAKEGSKEKLTAQDALAIECWEYPKKGSEGYKAALELAPLILANAALQIVLASQGRAEQEGKK